MSKSICVIGVPMDLGQARRGVDMGPAALRYAGLARRLKGLGCSVRDCGNVEISLRDTLPDAGGMSFLPAVAQACEAIYRRGRETLAAGDLPLYLGGDHSIAMGTVGAASHGLKTGLLWIDAHADFNTPESSPSGNIHGMPLAALTGHGPVELTEIGRPGIKIPTENAVLLGLRDLDQAEKVVLLQSGMKIYTMREIDERGIGRVAQDAVDYLGRLEHVHVSLDMDCLDPSEAPGVGTPVPGGLSYREAHLLMEMIAESLTVGSLDVVEINPILDNRNQTAELAIELILSVLGKTII
ncbi:MAG: arginase [Thermoanaerobaculia bacterium]